MATNPEQLNIPVWMRKVAYIVVAAITLLMWWWVIEELIVQYALHQGGLTQVNAALEARTPVGEVSPTCFATTGGENQERYEVPCAAAYSYSPLGPNDAVLGMLGDRIVTINGQEVWPGWISYKALAAVFPLWAIAIFGTLWTAVRLCLKAVSRKWPVSDPSLVAFHLALLGGIVGYIVGTAAFLTLAGYMDSDQAFYWPLIALGASCSLVLLAALQAYRQKKSAAH